ncbi:MAG: acylphosphatase [Candidatus Aenigmarchaeota archaeon]|nr:acylphosphatase [Candidatus Aenigmarchaeota archaeon]
MEARAHVLVSGMVIGVFFRATTRDLAASLGVKGWVCNTGAGKLEAVFEGEREQVARLVEFCAKGPPGAHVDGIDVRWEEHKGEFSGFEIKY